MELILIATVILMVLYGYTIFHKVDLFTSTPCFFPTEEKAAEKAKTKVLVYGKSDLAGQVITTLKKKHIPYTIITDGARWDVSGGYAYLLALTGDDLDNLLMCAMGKKRYTIPTIIALCNQRENHTVFEANEIVYFAKGERTAEQIISILLNTAMREVS